jgi:hypothetical protein
MIQETPKKSERKGKRPATANARVPGVRAAARALGVTPAHLWLTVTGHRESRRLMRRYQEYLAQQAQEAK